jgi:hypothetical protein
VQQGSRARKATHLFHEPEHQGYSQGANWTGNGGVYSICARRIKATEKRINEQREMTLIHLILAVSIVLNGFLLWYLTSLLKKFFFISQNMSDTYLAAKAFSIFVQSMYSMDSYHGEPMIQELMLRIQEVLNDMEKFRDIFEYTIDAELEEELDEATEEEA